MSSVLDETSIRTSRPGLTQANGSRSLVQPLGRHGLRRLTYALMGHTVKRAVMHFGREGNCRSGVTLAMRHRLGSISTYR